MQFLQRRCQFSVGFGLFRVRRLAVRVLAKHYRTITAHESGQATKRSEFRRTGGISGSTVFSIGSGVENGGTLAGIAGSDSMGL